LMSDFDASEFSVQGTSYAVQANALSFTLDHSTANTDLDVANITVENVKALTFTSNGHATSESSTAQNNIGTLDGDATTITILGDTSFTAALDIDAVETATSTTTARTVTVNASGMTGNAFVVLTAATDSKVTYNMTGTANDDQLSTNATGGSLVGGAGDDVLTGGNGVNVISGDDGDDEINVSFGLDILTGGAGDDTYDINDLGDDVSPQVTVAAVGDALTAGTITIASGDKIQAVVNGIVYETTSGGTVLDTALDLFQTQHAAAILADHDITVTSTPSTATGLTFTGDGSTAFTADVRFLDAAVSVAVEETTTAAVAALDTLSTITDFAAGDVLDLAGLSLGVAYFEGDVDGTTAADAADNGLVVITDQAYATAEAAEDDIAASGTASNNGDNVFIFLNSTLGYAQAVWDTDLSEDDTVGTTDVIINFTGITTLTQLAAAFSADSVILS